MIFQRISLLILFCFLSMAIRGQAVRVVGNVVDEASEPIEFVTVFVKNTSINDESDSEGRFAMELPKKNRITLVFSRLGYVEYERVVTFGSQDLVDIDVILEASESDLDVTVTDSRLEEQEMIRESTEAMKLLPSTTGNLESVLPHIALGARSGTGGELSSQYNVRGGNYDENLVYVNDFEIFRPQLIRNSQQEGLTFPNIDLIRDLSFSSGGYQPKYGDKMSSVLDIKYKRPDEFKASAAMSFLGGSAHMEGSQRIGQSDYKKLRYLFGARYKTTKHLLGSLDTEGEYTPEFADIQAYITYDFTKDLQLGLLTNYNESQYDFRPISRSTAFGLIDLALQLTSVFEGEESDVFKTGMAGASLTYLPERDRNPLFIKLLASTYRGEEKEGVDVRGFYRLSQVETEVGEETGQEIAVLGIGTQHRFTRNRLFNKISNIQLRGGIEYQSQEANRSHFIQWGVKYQHEFFDDRLKEWERLDSAGYSLPYSENEVLLSRVLRSENLTSSGKTTGFIQDTYTSEQGDGSELRLTGGTRMSYWSLNDQLTISPRAQLLFKPSSTQNIIYKLAGGVYYQTPLYRELRRPDGTINTNIQAQKSIHFVAGLARDFSWESMSEKPFRFIAEAYYKNLSNLITYDLDNVRIRYTGENDASGYAAGLDLRVNGEFVPGAESWLNVSLLRVRESLSNIEHKSFNSDTGEFDAVSDVPRPTDQFFNLSLYFQDYLPRNENFKVNLNLTFGGGLPFGIPNNNTEIRNTFRFRAYRRVDMGFSWQMWNETWRDHRPNSLLRSFRNVAKLLTL